MTLINASLCGTNFFKANIVSIGPHESVYIYGLTTMPRFKRITIYSERLSPNIEYDFSDYSESTFPSLPSDSGFFPEVLKEFGGFW